MSWWNAKYKNNHGEYEITFASKTYEKAKAVERICQAVIDKKVKSREDVEAVVRCKKCIYAKKNYLVNGLCLCEKTIHDAVKGEVPRNTLMTEDDFCSYGERRDVE